MSGKGTHPRVAPEGWMISSRDVTSKVRHFVPPLVSAPIAVSGRARLAAARVVAPVLRNVRLSMYPPFGRLAVTGGILNGIGRRDRVKLVLPMTSPAGYRALQCPAETRHHQLIGSSWL